MSRSIASASCREAKTADDKSLTTLAMPPVKPIRKGSTFDDLYWKCKLPQGFLYLLDILAKGFMLVQPSHGSAYASVLMDDILERRKQDLRNLPDVSYLDKLKRKVGGQCSSETFLPFLLSVLQSPAAPYSDFHTSVCYECGGFVSLPPLPPDAMTCELSDPSRARCRSYTPQTSQLPEAVHVEICCCESGRVPSLPSPLQTPPCLPPEATINREKSCGECGRVPSVPSPSSQPPPHQPPKATINREKSCRECGRLTSPPPSSQPPPPPPPPSFKSREAAKMNREVFPASCSECGGMIYRHTDSFIRSNRVPDSYAGRGRVTQDSPHPISKPFWGSEAQMWELIQQGVEVTSTRADRPLPPQHTTVFNPPPPPRFTCFCNYAVAPVHLTNPQTANDRCSCGPLPSQQDSHQPNQTSPSSYSYNNKSSFIQTLSSDTTRRKSPNSTCTSYSSSLVRSFDIDSDVTAVIRAAEEEVIADLLMK